MHPTYVNTTQLPSAVLVGLALALPGCGGPVGAPPVVPAPSPSASAAPSLPPAEHIALDVFKDGVQVGTEAWAVTRQTDGTTDIAFDAILEEKGVHLKGSGTLSLAADLTARAGTLALETPDGPVKGELRVAGPAMSLKVSRGDESRDVRAERPSNIFLPQPFFVGFARLCPLFEAGTPALVEFPGSPLTVTDHQALTGSELGVTVYTVEHGELGRTILACEKGELVAASDPWTGESAARPGRRPVLDALVAATSRHKPPTPAGLVEEEVTVTVPATAKDAEAKLACSFLKPASPPGSGKGASKAPRTPAVVFFSGSGPQDRDEDTVGPGGVKLSLFKFMAVALAGKGVASLRCDDRGTAASTGSFEKATFPTFVRDAEEMLKAVRLRADVDPPRVGLIGHSEGSLVAPVAARADGKIKAVVLMAPLGRSIPDLAVAQQTRMLEQAGLPKEQVEQQLAAQAEVLKAIRQGDPLPATVPQAERAHIESQRPWLKSHFDHDAQRALREMPATAILLVQGAKDLQVPVEELTLVQKGLTSGKNAKARSIVYPTLNHLFAESRGGPATEYSDPHAVVDPTFLADVTAFFGQAFSAR